MGKYTMTRTSNKMRTWNAPDWNSYEDMMRYSSIPIIGGMYKARADYLEYQENLRWWQDYARNTGINLEDVRYPIRAGLYRGYRTGYEPYIEATESIIGLYGGNNLRKWL